MLLYINAISNNSFKITKKNERLSRPLVLLCNRFKRRASHVLNFNDQWSRLEHDNLLTSLWLMKNLTSKTDLHDFFACRSHSYKLNSLTSRLQMNIIMKLMFLGCEIRSKTKIPCEYTDMWLWNPFHPGGSFCGAGKESKQCNVIDSQQSTQYPLNAF